MYQLRTDSLVWLTPFYPPQPNSRIKTMRVMRWDRYRRQVLIWLILNALLIVLAGYSLLSGNPYAIGTSAIANIAVVALRYWLLPTETIRVAKIETVSSAPFTCWVEYWMSLISIELNLSLAFRLGSRITKSLAIFFALAFLGLALIPVWQAARRK